MSTGKHLIIIAGPTAVGKTAVAIEVAKHFQTEIVSADSRQVYQELRIGVARPAPQELQAVKHHFIANKSIHESFSAGDYEREGIALLDDLFKRHDAVVLCGGTGLYIRAICEGFDEIPAIDPHIRQQLVTEFLNHGIEPLQQQLEKLDPETFARMDIQNTQRLIRALEVCIGTGVPYATFRQGKKAVRSFTPVKIGLNLDRDELYRRIDARVDQMMEQGLLDEARAVYPYKHINALQTVGYQELFDHFDGKCTLDEAVKQIKQHTRNYAKRQLTWFRKDPEYTWFDPDQNGNILQFIRERTAS